MPKVTSKFAKIVATPTSRSWSQAYSAGSLYAVISLTKEDEASEASLNVVGKGIINNLEAEFFALEEKTLTKIKEAIASAIESMPEDVLLDLALAYNKEDVLYLYVIKDATILLKRDEKIATILQRRPEDKSLRSITGSSGYLKDKDTLVLQTHQFQNLVDEKELAEALSAESIQETAETLSPTIHQATEGGATAILINVDYPEDKKALLDNEAEVQEDTDEEPETTKVATAKTIEKEKVVEENNEELEDELEKDEVSEDPLLPHTEAPIETPDEERQDDVLSEDEPKKKFSIPGLNLNHKKKIILTIALVLLIVLGASVYSATKNQQDTKNKALFEEIYTAAEKDYEEGEDLLSLNENVARDDFLSAQKTLVDGKSKFKEGTTERSKLDELLKKVEARLGGTSPTKTLTPKAVDEEASILLATQLENKAQYASMKDNSVFFITSKAVVESVDGKNDEVIENDNDWKSVRGLGTFLSNIYVLDANEGLLKFAATADTYGKSNYFTGDAPDTSDAVDMTIDGAVWILTKSGEISKYTKGEPDSFKVTGLDKPFSSPKKIYTTEDLENVYILDNGNNRIVKLNKVGAFQEQYSAAILKSATGLEVNEEENSIFVLSDGRIWQLSME